MEVLKASISLILFAVAQLKICPSDEKDEIIKEAFARLKGTLWEWIVDRKVIGGSVFGGSLPSRYFSGGWKAKEELEVTMLDRCFMIRECVSGQCLQLYTSLLVKVHQFNSRSQHM